jgi:hypothetical protein
MSLSPYPTDRVKRTTASTHRYHRMQLTRKYGFTASIRPALEGTAGTADLVRTTGSRSAAHRREFRHGRLATGAVRLHGPTL